MNKFLRLKVPTSYENKENLEKFGNIAFGGFSLVLLTAVGGIIYAIITGMILAGKQPWVGVLLVAFIVFAVLTLAYVVLNEDLKERKQKQKPGLQNELEARDTAKLLEEKLFEPIPSVTEDSTELLLVENKTKKFE